MKHYDPSPFSNIVQQDIQRIHVAPAKANCDRWMSEKVILKVACTSALIFAKIMKRYPIFSVQIINYQIDQIHK